MTDDYTNVPARVRAILRDRAETLSAGPRNEVELAEVCGWSRSTLRSYLDGRRPVSRERVEAIARALGLDAAALTSRDY